jgi:septum formation protein
VSQLILASTSPRREALLVEAGFSPLVVPPETEELRGSFLTPRELVLLNAHRKAVAVSRRHPDAVVLAADTLVVLGSQLFGKPHDLAEARSMLQCLVGNTHEVITGICLIHAQAGKVRSFTEISEVTFRHLNSKQIDRYLEQANPLDKAGAYAAQAAPDLIIERVDGSFSNVIGLPMESLAPALKELGVTERRESV